MPASARIWIAAGIVAVGFLIAWNWQANKYDKRLADQELAYSVASTMAVQLRWVMRDAQAVLFEEFYRVDLEDGTAWFEMPLDLPQGRGPWMVQLQGIYTGPRRLNAPGGEGAWEYSADMMLFLRPGEQMPVD